nr:MAG TPA: hypothetical protein [Caudoviricetes sp.]
MLFQLLPCHLFGYRKNLVYLLLHLQSYLLYKSARHIQPISPTSSEDK